MNHDNCWIWFIILWGWSFLSPMIVLIPVIFLGLYRCEFVNLNGSLFLKTSSDCNVKNSPWVHVEYRLQLGQRLHKLLSKYMYYLKKINKNIFRAIINSIPPLLTHRGSSTFYFFFDRGDDGMNVLTYRYIYVTGSPVLNSSVSEVSRKSTVGSLDMGGGSAQIAFEVAKSVSTWNVKHSTVALHSIFLTFLHYSKHPI